MEVFSGFKEYLATGYYQEESIAVKIISFRQREINEDFWLEKFQDAYDLRVSLGLVDNTYTTALPPCFRGRRWYSRADHRLLRWGLCDPGTDDRHPEAFLASFVNCLQKIYGSRLKAVYLKSDHRKSGGEASSYLLGTMQTGLIKETGHLFCC